MINRITHIVIGDTNIIRRSVLGRLTLRHISGYSHCACKHHNTLVVQSDIFLSQIGKRLHLRGHVYKKVMARQT